MLIWYVYDAIDGVFVTVPAINIPGLFLRNMRLNECYWLVPGTEG